MFADIIKEIATLLDERAKIYGQSHLVVQKQLEEILSVDRPDLFNATRVYLKVCRLQEPFLPEITFIDSLKDIIGHAILQLRSLYTLQNKTLDLRKLDDDEIFSKLKAILKIKQPFYARANKLTDTMLTQTLQLKPYSFYLIHIINSVMRSLLTKEFTEKTFAALEDNWFNIAGYALIMLEQYLIDKKEVTKNGYKSSGSNL